MKYLVKEIFYTLQGEGAQAGRPAVFLRFTGCNLWTGREEDRARAACTFCDTDFVGTDGTGGGVFHEPGALAKTVRRNWEGSIGQRIKPLVVCTGGEPLLQLDTPLVQALHEQGFEVAVETNGTLSAPPDLDWICVSPKPRSPLRLRQGNELKLVYPQEEVAPEQFADLHFDFFYLQPMDGPRQKENVSLATAYCLAHPQWRLSLQTHKWIGLR